MITKITLKTKETRAFGWVQDSSSIESLCNVVAVFDSESSFHKKLKNEIIPVLVADCDGRDEMLAELNSKNIALKYRLLTGTAFYPRSESRCNGIIQAAVKGQKRDFIGDWPADNFIRWAHAVGFIKYDYFEDSFSITDKGLELTRSLDDSSKKNILINALLSYPPAYRILSLLKNPEEPLTKYELGEKLGFTGEEGFSCYPIRNIVAALSETEDKKERAKIRADWESSSDKYARTIAQWLKQLGLVKTCTKEVVVAYGNKILSQTLNAYVITPQGERILRNIDGNSRHPRVVKMVSYEMFATKGSDREYLRLRRSMILKALVENRRPLSLSQIEQYLKDNNIEESHEIIYDDVLGFVNIGLNIEIKENNVILLDNISDFYIPVYQDLTKKSELSIEKDRIRKQLRYISHEYLVLMDLAFDSKQNRLFEMKTMDLFVSECGFYGCHLGSANKPDGILYTGKDGFPFGIIVDMKAYSKGYSLPIGQQDEMKRYISNNQRRDEVINPTKWWNMFPEYLNVFYYMFVSGYFRGDLNEKLNRIYRETSVKGTAMPIVEALLLADKIKSGEFQLADFPSRVNNSQFSLNV